MQSQGDQLAGFLRARYTEAREREHAKHRVIPSVFDGHSVEWVRDSDGERLLVDGHPYPIEKYVEIATEPAPDPVVLADLDAKLAILDLHARLDDLPFCVTCDAPSGIPGQPEGCATLRVLAVPFAAHPDYDERWRP